MELWPGLTQTSSVGCGHAMNEDSRAGYPYAEASDAPAGGGHWPEVGLPGPQGSGSRYGRAVALGLGFGRLVGSGVGGSGVGGAGVGGSGAGGTGVGGSAVGRGAAVGMVWSRSRRARHAGEHAGPWGITLCCAGGDANCTR